MAKIKKGDMVQIIAGKDKGKKGRVIKVFPKENRVVVENANLRKKHVRPKKGGEKGQKIEVPVPVSVSVVMLICKSCGKISRVGSKIMPDGSKRRICKKCGGEA